MDFLKGKKTYIIAIVAGVVVTMGMLGFIDENTQKALLGFLGAGGLATLRAGVSSTVK